MPTRFANALTDAPRNPARDRQLGVMLAGVAGALNAGGFMVVGRYTSHMTGVVSAAADSVALNEYALALAAAVMVVCFVTGAISTSVIASMGRRLGLVAVYAPPLIVEALLLLVFGLAGAHVADRGQLLFPVTVALLCFVMGLQNAVVAKLSSAEIRTTHMTGVLTDIGVAVGRRLMGNSRRNDKLGFHAAMLGSFVLGGTVGALAFRHFGFISTLPLAVILLVLSVPAVVKDFPRRPET